MTYGALAVYLGAVLFRPRGGNGSDGRGGEGLRMGVVPAARRLPGDPAMVEDDYYRFLNQPKD